MLDSRWGKVTKLLLMRLDNIGDIVLLSASIRTIKENLPWVKLTLMASPAGAQAVPLLPWLDDLMVWRAIWQDVGGKMPLDPARELDLVKSIESRRFDSAIIFTSFSQSPHGPAYVCYLAGIPLRLGESKEFGGGLLTDEVRDMADGLYQAERSLQMLERVGFVVNNRRPQIQLPIRARLLARALLAELGVKQGEPYLLVHPGASCQARRYPLEKFALIAGLMNNRLRMPVLLTGSAKEASDLEAVAARSDSSIFSLAGRTQVEELAALIAESALVVCNDSLPTHLCAALDVPSVVLYSGTDLESQWGSPFSPTRLLRRETPCHPCYRFQCPYNLECLDFHPEEVFETVTEMLGHSAVKQEIVQPSTSADGAQSPVSTVSVEGRIENAAFKAAHDSAGEVAP